MKTLLLVVCMALGALSLGGCSFVTEFDETLMDEGVYSLNENLPEAISVLLRSDGRAEVALTLAEPLPDDVDVTVVRELLDTAIVSLVLANETGVTADLVDGELMDSADAVTTAGQWAVGIDGDRQAVTVTFWNETADGSMLRVDGSYTATIGVTPNAYFSEESLTRSVIVTQ